MFKQYIDKFKEEVIALNDYLVDNPEIGMQEFKASTKIVEILRNHGIEVEFPFSGFETAFRGTINKGKSTKLAIIAEYDALRGLGHACGHSASGSISVLATLMLNEIAENIDAQIDIIGTPDEEISGGKVIMVENGVFDKYDAAIMIHMGNMDTASINLLAVNGFSFEFKGKAAHAAATPHEGKNALNAVRLVMNAIDMMRQHVTSDVRIHEVITSGGGAVNIVPDFASMDILARAMERTNLNDVVEWLQDIGKAAALATRTEFTCKKIGNPYHNLSQKETGNSILEKLFVEQGRAVMPVGAVASGSSDIGNVDYIIPAFHPKISIGIEAGVHTKDFVDAMKNPDTHKAILDGAEIMAKFIKKLSDEPNTLEQIKSEHRRNRGI